LWGGGAPERDMRVIMTGMPEPTTEHAPRTLPLFSSFLFKLFGKTIVFGLVPLAVMSYLLIPGYENLLRGGTTADIELFRTKVYFTLSILTIFIFAGGFLTDVLLVRPIRSLMRFLEHIDWDNPAQVTLPRSEDEVGELVAALRTTIENFNRIRERDQSLSRAKNEFLSIAAHQLRTPLTRIKWALEQLQDESIAEDKKKEYVGQLRGSADEMIELIGNLLSVVRIEQNRFGHDFKKADLKGLLSATVGSFSDTAHTKNLSLSLDMPEGLPAEAIMDIDGITIALSNLITNAINYTPPGGHITVRLAPADGARLAVSVADTGIGIPETERSRIATSFFRATNAQKTQPNGSGIGLFIAKNIVERHGGELSFNSTEGKGTTFVFTVPTEEKDIPKSARDFNEFFSTLGVEAVGVRPRGDNERSARGEEG